MLAATIETVSRVGPCEAEINLVEISDVRETKRKQIIERAAELLKEWDSKSLEPSEIEEKMDKDIRLGEITSWGPEKLPAGPDLINNSEIIIVEGRADVLNLLRIGVKNTVAVQGTQVPKSIVKLTKEKSTVIAFLDGDRGGTIILNELLQVAKIDFVVRAPDGLEVEELTRKQLIRALQNKKKPNDLKKRSFSDKNDLLGKLLKKLKVKDEAIIKDAIKDVKPLSCIGFNKKLHKTFDMPVGEIFEKIKLPAYKDTIYLIIDGILSNRLLSISINKKIKFIACKNKEEKLKIPSNILIYFF